VTSLCRKLDGMPLAIELASARVRVLSVEQISSRLEDSFTLLTGGSRTALPRQRTLRAAIDWSHQLLTEEERVLLRRIAVFVGGFTLEASEEVCSGKGIEEYEVLDLVAQLVDKSLVTVAEQDGEARYWMLESIRQFGREKLEESTEEPEVLRRHAEHYLALAETAEPELLGADQGLWLQRLRTEFGNLREALSWSLEPGEHAQELRLRLAAALCRFWEAQSFEEGKRWLQAALGKDPGGFPAVRAKALGGLGFILLFQQDYGAAIAALEEAIALYKELGDESGVALAFANLGYVMVRGGYRERMPAFVGQGEALMQEGNLEGHPRAHLRIVLACAAIEEGDLDSVVAQLEEGLALSRKLGSLWHTGAALVVLGMIELLREHLDRGAALLEEAARLARELKDRLGSPYSVWLLGRVAFLRGRPIRAARLWGAAEALREQRGMPLCSRFDLALSGYEQDLAAVRSALSEASFEAAWAEGRAMSPEQDIEYALEPTPHTEQEEDAHPPAAGAAALRAVALGPARVEKGGRPLDSADWIQKPQELLFYLLSRPPRTKEQIGLGLLLVQERTAEAAEAYRKAIAYDGFLEEAHRGLMRCHVALGELGRALRHYEELVELLDEQLGASPAPETSALHARLRADKEV
jgi:tetratricopeptide (TPR) repeat protein